MADFSFVPEAFLGSVTSTGVESSAFKQYRSFVKQELGDISDNVRAYLGKTPRKFDFYNGQRKPGLRKVLKGATFIPAHPTRWQPGFELEPMTHFVVHRPGIYAPACTLVNIIREFTSQHRPASTHFVIGFNGELIQMVDLEDESYHAGKSPGLRKGGRNANKFSVGVELEGAVGEKLTFAQYTTLAKLLRILADNSQLDLDANPRVVVGHEEIRPKDKIDPGPNFDYDFVLNLARRIPSDPGSPFTEKPLDIDTILAGVLSSSENAESFGSQALLGQVTSDTLATIRSVKMGLFDRAGIAELTAFEHQKMVARENKRLAEQLRMQYALLRINDTLTAVPVPGAAYDFQIEEPKDEGED